MNSDFNDLHTTQGLDVVGQQVAADIDAMQEAFVDIDLSATFSAADEAAQGAMPEPPPDENWQERFHRTEKGNLKPDVFNLHLVMTHDKRWMDVLGYCDFSYRVIKLLPPPGDSAYRGEWEDADLARLRIWVSNVYGFTPSQTDCMDSLIAVAQANRFHPVREYLQGVAWDGESRLDTWLQHALKAEAKDPRYLHLVGRKFLIGAVARIMDPGCKMDTVLILEGLQGKGKSTVVKVLFGEDFFSDSPLQIGDKDAFANIQGVWCAELAEMDSFNKAESTTAKSFFSSSVDRFRPSYGRVTQAFKRQCVFVGTTNQDEYLKDYTGNRRYWPVRCEAINVEWVRAHRDQLWAEAVHLYRNKVTHWIENDEDKALFDEEQEDRLLIDPWEDKLACLLPERTDEYLTSDVILKEILEKDSGHQQRADQTRLGPIMQKLGWYKKRKEIFVGSASRKAKRHVYINPDPRSVNKGDDDYELPEIPNDA